jgi:micrococcal nuclease
MEPLTAPNTQCDVCQINPSVGVCGQCGQRAYCESLECLQKDWSIGGHMEDCPNGRQKRVSSIRRIVDGDTVIVTMQDPKEEINVRLVGIDAPERQQTYGTEATRALQQLMRRYASQLYLCVSVDEPYDRYGRLLGTFFALSKRRWINLNRTMVRQGAAWAYRADPRYTDDQLVAQTKKRGLWSASLPPPTEPYKFRQMQRHLTTSAFAVISDS